MGLFDTFFSSVTGGSREPQKPSNVELELRRRLTVLASDEATQDTPLRYFLALGGASPRRWFSLYQHQPRAGTRTHRLGA